MFEGGSAQPPARKQKMPAHNNFKRTIWLGLLTTGIGISPTLGNTKLSKPHDCTTIELEAVIDQNASREDNLERLSQQFFQSVNRVEHCDRELQTNSDLTSSSSAADATANASADADTPAQNTASPGGVSTSPTAAQTYPSRSLVGTSLAEDLPNMVAPSASNMAGTTPMADPADMGTATSNMTGTEAGAETGTETGTMTGTATDAESETAAVTARPQMQQAEPDQRLTNGTIPDDIPNADNDSAFEVQIRAAAMAETDPDTQKNLWNEYRRYKGLPEQE
jgi:hypothetical protein